MPVPNGWIYGDCGCCCETVEASDSDCDCPDTDGSSYGIEVLNVNLVADMAAVVPYTGLKEFQVLGLTTVFDGLGGIWAYFPTSSVVSDGYYRITPPGGVGRYIKMV